jgi:hypothetical protein
LRVVSLIAKGPGNEDSYQGLSTGYVIWVSLWLLRL